MSGILLCKNNETKELCLLVGKVLSARETEGSRYEVVLGYRDDDANRTETRTRIVFRNQPPRTDGGRGAEWAEWAKNMRMREGSIICATVRFTDETHTAANGYRCYYNGVVTVTSDAEHKEDRYAVGGLVTWMRERKDSKGRPYISMGVYTGRDRFGELQTVHVNVFQDKVLAGCRKHLAPGTDGIKKYAWFACNGMYEAMSSNGDEYPIYTAYSYMETGVRNGR